MINEGSNMYAENMIKICFRVLIVISLTVIGISTSAAAGRKRPHVTRNNNVMILEYDFEEPDIITKGDFDFVTINGFTKSRKNKNGDKAAPDNTLCRHGFPSSRQTNKKFEEKTGAKT